MLPIDILQGCLVLFEPFRALWYKHNFDGIYGGKKYEDFNPDILFEALGIEPDWEKIKYYRLLDELF